MKIAGVVIFYNPTKEIVGNINSYIKDIDKLYVVDNSSKDNSKMIKKASNIVYIPNFKNLGIAKALNIGGGMAVKDGFEWLLTMDQDSTFMNNGVLKMKEFLINKKKNDTKYYKKIGLLSPYHDTGDTSNPIESDIDNPLMVMTSGNLINLEAYKKIGGFNSDLFIDTVDFDYCLNLRNHNYEIVRLNNIKLKHKLGDLVYGSLLGRKMYSSNHSAVRRYYQVRNRHYIFDMYNKNYPDYCNAEIGRTKRELVKIWGCEKQRLKKSIYMLRGYLDYKKGIMGSYEERKKHNKKNI